MPYKQYFIDQASSVKMAGYWSRSAFASLWTSTSPRSIKPKKRTRPISSHLDLALAQLLLVICCFDEAFVITLNQLSFP